MQNKLQRRLQTLQSEFESGQKMLADLEAKQMQLRETLLRISGAIQVLEELLNESSETNGAASLSEGEEAIAPNPLLQEAAI